MDDNNVSSVETDGVVYRIRAANSVQTNALTSEFRRLEQRVVPISPSVASRVCAVVTRLSPKTPRRRRLKYCLKCTSIQNYVVMLIVYGTVIASSSHR